MLNDKFLIQQFLSCFKLNEKASKRELQIAYNVLTKNATPEQYNNLRRAFEYLMFNFYGIDEETTVSNIMVESDKNQLQNEPTEKEVVNSLPEHIQEGIGELDKDTMPLDEKVKLSLATQKVNTPLLYLNIKRYCKNFLGFKFLTKKDLDKVVSKSCLTPLVYCYFTFIIDSDLSFSVKNIQNFTHNLKKIIYKDKPMCKSFIYSNTNTGVLGRAIIEENLLSNILDLINFKCNSEEWVFNFSID